MALTPNDVLNKQFTTTKFKDGYDQDEVDDFLDEVLAEFQRLIADNDSLKSQLGSRPAGGEAAADSGEVASLREQLAERQSQLEQVQNQLAQTQTELEQTKQAAQQAGLDGMNSAEYLQLARRVHEEHVREGVAKRDQLVADGTTQAQTLVSEAQTTADGLIAEAQQRANGLVNEAQSTADTLRSEAQQQADALTTQAQQTYDSQVAALTSRVAELEQSKTALERNVSELQEFERNYRASLKSHLEAQLSELESAGGSTGTGPSAEPTTGSASVESGHEVVDLASDSVVADSAGEAGGEQIFDYGQRAFGTSPTPSYGIPDFGTQRLDPGAQDLPSFGQSTGEQPAGFGGN